MVNLIIHFTSNEQSFLWCLFVILDLSFSKDEALTRDP